MRAFALPLNRNTSVALTLVLLHVGAIMALQSGLLARAVETVVPVEMLSISIESPAPLETRAPKIEQPKVAPQITQPAVQNPPPVVQAPSPVMTPSPVVTPAPANSLPVVAAVTAAPTPAPAAITVAAPAPSPVSTPAPVQPTLQLPSSDADYLQNPKPAYPAMSRRNGEQGKTVVRVLIGVDGLPKQIELGKSSGFERLDRAALDTIARWRFVPGKRAGVPEPMWFNVPINWVLG